MTSVRLELYSTEGTLEQQWNVSRRFALACHLLNKAQNTYVFDNQGLVTKSFPGRDGKLTLVVNKETPVFHQDNFFLRDTIPNDVEDQDVKDSVEAILRNVTNALRQ